MTFIPLAVPNIGPEDQASVASAMQGGWVSSVGPDVPAFEADIAAVCGVPEATVVASGTAAITIALKACGVKRGDLVLCPDYTFIATANAITAAGADPVFVDIDPETWATDVQACEKALADLAAAGMPQPTAMVVVYPMGNPIDLAPFKAFAQSRGIAVVADAAAAIGARFAGQSIGLLADATSFSFNGNKTMTTGGGGAIVGSPEVVRLCRHMASTGRVGSNYDHDMPAVNERMTNLEAALGRSQIARLNQFIEAKKRIRDSHENYARSRNLGAFPRHPEASHGDWFSGIILPEGRDVDDVVRFMNEKGVGVRQFWKPMHMQKAYAGLLDQWQSFYGASPAARFPVSAALWRKVLPLPCSTHLTDAELDIVHNTLDQALAATAAASAPGA